MSTPQAILMRVEHPGAAADEGVDRLRNALVDAEISAPDENATFEIRLDADSVEDAVRRVWDAIAAAGADDHVIVLEHPHVENHSRRREGADQPGGAHG